MLRPAFNAKPMRPKEHRSIRRRVRVTSSFGTRRKSFATDSLKTILYLATPLEIVEKLSVGSLARFLTGGQVFLIFGERCPHSLVHNLRDRTMGMRRLDAQGGVKLRIEADG